MKRCTRDAMPKILLVEDNEMNRDMLSRRLQRKGYQVVLAVDGKSGMEMTQTQAPDWVLMDMSLPVPDGWEATRRLKEPLFCSVAPQHPTTPTTGRRPFSRTRCRGSCGCVALSLCRAYKYYINCLYNIN